MNVMMALIAVAGQLPAINAAVPCAGLCPGPIAGVSTERPLALILAQPTGFDRQAAKVGGPADLSAWQRSMVRRCGGNPRRLTC